MPDTLSHAPPTRQPEAGDISVSDTTETASPKLKGRAIVTYGRSLMSLVIVRSLHERGIEVIGCDDVDLTVLSFSKHTKDCFTHPHFERDTDDALNRMEEAVRKYAPDDDRPYVLIPAFRDAKLFAEHRDRFEPLIRIAAPDLASIQLIHPKDQFAHFAEKHGLEAPETRQLTSEEFRSASASDLDLPKIIKPLDGVGGRGVRLLKDENDITAYRDELKGEEDLLLQTAVDGSDYCVSIAAKNGELIAISAYRNIRQFPVESGAGAIRETVDAAPFLETTKNLVAATKWNGVAEIDFRWDEDSDAPAQLIEVNPRFWAGLFHSTESGIDFPWLAYSIAAGLPVPELDPNAAEIGFKSRTPAAWILSVAEEIASEDKHMLRTSDAWDELRKDVSNGAVISALKHFTSLIGHSALSAKALARLQEELKQHGDLPSEFTVDNDPATGLGVLFALSSVLRHGELPPELKFDADAPAEPGQPVEPKTGRPVIGITKPDKGDFFAFRAMKFAVWLAGGKPVSITSSAPRDPQSIDGLLFGGGSDVYPERYAQSPLPGVIYDLARDEMEASWAKAAFEHGIPMMGVCRGMQMMNVYAGGTLYPDLSDFEEHYPTSFIDRIFYRKPIRVGDASILYKLTGRKTLSVNSIHTQAVEKIGGEFHAIAQEHNGLIQAIEHKEHPFALGIQFHPEFLVYRKFARDIFKGFVEAARAHRDRA